MVTTHTIPASRTGRTYKRGTSRRSRSTAAGCQMCATLRAFSLPVMAKCPSPIGRAEQGGGVGGIGVADHRESGPTGAPAFPLGS